MSKKGRPIKGEEVRNNVINVRMSDDEVRILDHLASKNGENRADVLRKLVLFAYFDGDFS